MALVAVLLTTAAMATLALASATLGLMDLRMAANRRAEVAARAAARSSLTAAVLDLELAAADGSLPAVAPATPGLIVYRRESDTAALISVEGLAGRARHTNDARAVLTRRDGGWVLGLTATR